MAEILCTNCNKINQLEDGLDHIYCKYCGQKIILKDDKIQLKSILDKLIADKDPVYIHQRLMELDKEYPDNLDIKRAILFQGRLHERSPKHLDFSVIHCYLLNVFLERETEKGQKNKFMQELMHGTNLNECLRLTDNKNLFLQEYYVDLSKKYIELFLMGSSKYMRQFFGLSFSKNPAKTLAVPCTKLIKNILSEEAMQDYRFVLAKSFYIAFGKKFGNDYSYLNEELESSLELISEEYRMINL